VQSSCPPAPPRAAGSALVDTDPDLVLRYAGLQDLMFPHPDDPPCAKTAREVEEEHIRKWIKEAYTYRSNLH
jgi:hypothetical protein